LVRKGLGGADVAARSAPSVIAVAGRVAHASAVGGARSPEVTCALALRSSGECRARVTCLSDESGITFTGSIVPATPMPRTRLCVTFEFTVGTVVAWLTGLTGCPIEPIPALACPVIGTSSSSFHAGACIARGLASTPKQTDAAEQTIIALEVRITHALAVIGAVALAVTRFGAITDLAAVVPKKALLALLACVPAPAFMAGAAFTSTSPVAVTGLVGQAPHVAVSPVMPELLRSIVRRIHHSST
jgi:hypothetical protein